MSFPAKLAQRLETPQVQTARLYEVPDCYKIELRSVGYRLVYQVHDERAVVVVMTVGRRDKGLVYLSTKKRV